MNIPAFDTYKAVQALKKAGFEEAQATAVVSTIGEAGGADLDALREDVAALPTREDLDNALRSYATREDLKALVTKDRLDAGLAKFEEQMIKYLTATVLATAGIVLAGVKWL